QPTDVSHVADQRTHDLDPDVRPGLLVDVDGRLDGGQDLVQGAEDLGGDAGEVDGDLKDLLQIIAAEPIDVVEDDHDRVPEIRERRGDLLAAARRAFPATFPDPS